MKRKMVYLTLIAGILVAGTLAWILMARAAYESADYTVIKTEGKFEIREYPDLMLVSTEMRSASQGRDGSFMRLFRYIGGANDDEQKVAMTTPVFMEDGDENDTGQMGFVIPREVVSSGVPKPSAADVKIGKREGGRFAVIRFSGRMDAAMAEKAEAKLRKWLAAKGLQAENSVEVAGYDPPFTPGPLRRNEILIRLTRLDHTATSAENSSGTTP